MERRRVLHLGDESIRLVEEAASRLQVHQLLHVEGLVLELEEVDFFVCVPREEVDLLEEELHLLLAPLVERPCFLHVFELNDLSLLFGKHGIFTFLRFETLEEPKRHLALVLLCGILKRDQLSKSRLALLYLLGSDVLGHHYWYGIVVVVRYG